MSFTFSAVNDCTQLDELYLHNNALTFITTNNTYIQTLTVLTLRNNYLLTLTEDTFQYLPALRNIDVSNNSIQELSFAKPQLTKKQCVTNLTTLIVSHNNLSAIPLSLGRLCQLSHLSLSHNNIQTIPRYTIERLSDLYYIALDNNNINWLDVGTFNNPNLRWIDLAHNQITKLISMVFLYLPKVHHIDLSHNTLNYIYDYSIYHACASGTRIHLDISNNNLSSSVITNILRTFNHSKKPYKCHARVNMQANQIGSFAENKKQLKIFYKYKHLDIRMELHGNLLVCDAMLKSQLEYLYLYNLLPIFTEFKSLQCHNLNVSLDTFFYDTTLPALEKNFCPKNCKCNNFVNSHLRTENNFMVNCSSIDLEVLPSMQFYINTHLNLSHNLLRYLDNNASFSSHITYLDLSFNQITYISVDIWKSILLIRMVNLDNNQLTTLQYATDIFLNVSCSISLSILRNPVHCTYNRDLLDYYKPCVENVDQYRCGRSDVSLMSDLYHTDNLSHSNSVRTVFILIVLILVTSSSCVICCGVYYKRYSWKYQKTYQDRQRVYTTEGSRRHSKHTSLLGNGEFLNVQV